MTRNELLGLALTPREHTILRMVSEGWTDRKIGRELALHPNTIANHVTFALGKLGAVNRPHAVAIGYQRGLLGADLAVAS